MSANKEDQQALRQRIAVQSKKNGNDVRIHRFLSVSSFLKLLNGVSIIFSTIFLNSQKCFECQSSKPQWLIVNQGILCCINCTGALRMSSIQVDLWNARSCMLDILREEWILRLEHWGNEKAAKEFRENSTYIYFHTKYTSREAYINRWKVSCAVATALGQPLPEEPTQLPTSLDIPTNYAKTFILPGAESSSQ